MDQRRNGKGHRYGRKDNNHGLRRTFQQCRHRPLSRGTFSLISTVTRTGLGYVLEYPRLGWDD